MGALPKAPKKAPACNTDTMFSDKFASLFASIFPSLMIPKCSSKYVCATTLPATPLKENGLSSSWRREVKNCHSYVS